jgi:hypothetical protein
VYHCGYAGHPYYGHNYYDGYYVRHDANLSVSRGHYVWQPHYQAGSQPFTRSDGRRFTGPGVVQGGAHAADGYRNGGVSRSAGQQRHVAAGDPDTGRALRADGGAATHSTLTEPAPHGQLTTRDQVRDELRARAGTSTGSAALRSPGQYRSGDAGSSSHAVPPRPNGQQNAAGTASQERGVTPGRTTGQYRGNAPAAAQQHPNAPAAGQQHSAPQPSARQPTTSQERFVVPNNSRVARPPAGDARSSSAVPQQPSRSPGFVSPPPARSVTPNRGGAAAPPTAAAPRPSAGNSYRMPANPGRGSSDDSSFSGGSGGSPGGAPHDGGGAPRGPSQGGGNPGGSHGGGQSHGGGHRGATR